MKTLRQVIVAALAMLLVGSVAATHRAPGRSDAVTVPSLQVDGFDVEQVAQLSAGTPLVFSLFATPGANASLRIAGAQRRLPLQEGQTGVYEGSYVIALDDRITATSRVTVELWLADQAVTAVLDEPLLLGGASVASCGDDCGLVEAVRAVDEPRAPGAAGAIAGGLIGAIVGSQIGKGDRRKVAGILGALGGAYAGREIERSVAKRTRYEVVVRWPNGAMQARRYETQPPFRVGDRVRLANGVWQAETPAAPALPY